MGSPAAKQGDQIVATDRHFVIVPAGPPPPLLPHPFTGILDGNLSSNVKIMGMLAATQGSTASNTPPHIPAPPGTAFQSPPSNQGTVDAGSPTVRINGKPAARHGDAAVTCNEGTPNQPIVKAPAGTVLIG